MISKALIFAFSLLIHLSTARANVNDFCVADLTLPKGPAGYLCRNASTLTAEDFVFSGLSQPANTSNLFGFGLTMAIDAKFPALNGFGLCMFRVDLALNGVVPVHTHRVSELLIVIEGTIIAGFMDSNDVPYYRTLNKGEIMTFPPSLLHFQINVGDVPALFFVSLNSANPGVQVVDTSLFGNKFPTELVRKITLIDPNEIRRLKWLFGGTDSM